ncbi:hypothetical protein MATL_G00064410 [Megalops atlanticus]|uniref:Uncharacterized protein n=1 Tax=Megalops atlanticus TaxID=7932 RepID=A0A9D3Q961_MEGAT|nr:hypothetical protein MATL_G00064410 [Megalops atlanticus]
MGKKTWSERREVVRGCSTRDDPPGPGRGTSRGRFSESWKRLSSRQGSTKRSGLGSQQPPSVCAKVQNTVPKV